MAGEHLTDRQALDHIAHILRDPEWGAGMLEDIAAWVVATGRTVDGMCGSCDHAADESPDARCAVEGCECARHEPGSTWDRH